MDWLTARCFAIQLAKLSREEQSLHCYSRKPYSSLEKVVLDQPDVKARALNVTSHLHKRCPACSPLGSPAMAGRLLTYFILLIPSHQVSAGRSDFSSGGAKSRLPFLQLC